MTDRLIPRAKMKEGIDLCKSNILDYLKDARLIMSDGRLNHAYVSVQFAIEEFGKIVMLKDALMASTNDIVTVKGSVFTSHKGKSPNAWRILDQKFKTIFGEGDFDDEDFSHVSFVTDTKASHDTRLDCAFVDFDEGIWHIGRDIKQKLLEELINHIEENLSKL